MTGRSARRIQSLWLPAALFFLLLVLTACSRADIVVTMPPPRQPSPSPVFIEQADPGPLEIPYASATALMPPVAEGAATQSAPPTATLPPLDFAEGLGVQLLDWVPPSYPVPWSLRPHDHFFFTRPIAASEPFWLHARYRYGNTHFGEEPIHTGIDYVASRGTPVLAAGPGMVISAGYGLYGGVEDKTDPYGLAVAIEHDFGYQGQRLYTVYAHLSEIHAWRGQRVAAGDILGEVGDTGRASGSHLHFEVRLGENRFFHTRNPELWTVPAEGWGVLAGRIMSTWGYAMEERLLQLTHLESGERWDVWTYKRDTVHGDDYYQENFVIGDLPEGPYEAYISYWGAPFRAQFYLYPGQTNLIEFRGIEGFTIEPKSVSSSDS